jgi:hypothetical protein
MVSWILVLSIVNLYGVILTGNQEKKFIDHIGLKKMVPHNALVSRLILDIQVFVVTYLLPHSLLYGRA